jgi:hypothetical protein
VGVGVALALPWATGLASSAMRTEVARSNPAGSSAGILVEVPVMLGLFLVPLLPALWRRRPGEARSGGRWALVPVSLGMAGLAGSTVFALWFGTQVYPGDYFSNFGLGQLYIGGSKPAVLPLWLFLSLEVLTTFTFLVVFWRRRGLFAPPALGTEGAAVVLLATTQVLPMVLTGAVDRYHLAVAAPLVPLLAARISQAPRSSPRLEGGWALAALAVGVAFYAVAEQDRQAWREAVHRAAAVAYTRESPEHVYAGFDEMGDDWVVPELNRSGQPPGGLRNFALRLNDPRLELRFAAPGDPRPGAEYGSIAPGRVVIVAVR